MPRSFQGLQALRAVACLLVVWVHIAGWEKEYGIRTPIFREIHWFGFAGVDLFFVLSGFIITYSQFPNFGRPAAVPGFLFRRLWRILPTYWITLALLFGMMCMLFSTEIATPWLENVLHWSSLFPGPPTNAMLGTAWTLTYELYFYFMFVFLLMVPWRSAACLLSLWGIGTLTAIGAGWVETRTWAESWAHLLISPFTLEFLGGCFAAWLVHSNRVRHGKRIALIGLGYAVVMASILYGMDARFIMGSSLYRVLAFGPAAVLIVLGVATAECEGRLNPSRHLCKIGDASYSIYLWHEAMSRPAVIYGCLLPHARLGHTLWIFLTFVACVGGGMLLHRLVERPLLNLARRKPKAAPVHEPKRLAA